jgi:UDP-GlcNAc:undecaprenyl-phosphate GlcNAc-1-phosphate transferase
MHDNFSPIFSASIFTTIQCLFISWMMLKILFLANNDFLKFLYISSGKSATNARLLGGLSIGVSLFISIASLLHFYANTFNKYEIQMLLTALISISLVTIYGYIDDKFEVRVRFKLLLQLTSILSFAYINSSLISAQHPLTAFGIISILGLALVNGTNLLDGLDTLSAKLGFSTSAAFLYLGIISNSNATILLSIALIASLSIFYFFNKEPAQIYMGEIGGSLLGLIYYVQSTICYSQLKIHMTTVQATSLVLIAGCLPIGELAVSFLRRIWCKKSPFRGDRLHLHYIVKNKYRLTASATSTVIGLSNLGILCFGFIWAFSYNPISALGIVIVIYCQCYLTVCYAEWKSNLESENAHNIFKIFEGRTVNIIDSTQSGTFNIYLKQNPTRPSQNKKSA